MCVNLKITTKTTKKNPIIYNRNEKFCVFLAIFVKQFKNILPVNNCCTKSGIKQVKIYITNPF